MRASLNILGDTFDARLDHPGCMHFRTTIYTGATAGPIWTYIRVIDVL
jgi:hypothetical protein